MSSDSTRIQKYSFRYILTYVKRLVQRTSSYVCVQINTRHLLGPRVICRSSLDCVVVSVMRDCEKHVKMFIEHYQGLGVKHIFIMDNGSQDLTVNIAARYKNVTVLSCLLPFKKFKSSMRQFLTDKYSLNQWCIIADGDELFDFPFSDQISLENLVSYLEENQYEAVLTQMLDMYSVDEIITETELDNPKQAYRWFEVASIKKQKIPDGLKNIISSKTLKLHYGGVRARLFEFSPLISKFALIKPSFARKPVGLHLISWARIADLSAVLYHYKFFPDFTIKLEKAIEEKQYYKDSIEYIEYKRVLDKEGKFIFLGDNSLEIRCVEQLVELSFLEVSSTYESYVRNVLKECI